ncbi:MAG: GAF domain-containing protein, partial [Planctomycetes bacterium]|nr:GAF domain-containing protein [Planctomycetota bacterium]
MMLTSPPNIASILLLGTLPMLSFAAALRAGSRAAAATAFAAAVAIALATGYGVGPFAALPYEERHVTVQMLLVAIAALAPLFSALLAERDANATRLLQSEGVGKALLRILPDATYRLDGNGVVLDAALPEDPVLPTDRDVVGRHIRDVVPDDLSEQLEPHLERALAGQRSPLIEHRLVTPHGRRDLELRFVPLPCDQVMLVTRDITARKRTERQLTMQAAILEMIASGHPRAEVFDATCEGLETLIPDAHCTIMTLHGDRLHVAAARTLPTGYVQAIDGLQVGPNQGACGTAAFLGQNVICSDTLADPRTNQFEELIHRYDLNACWSVPVRSIDGSVIGTMALYHEQVREPQPYEVRLVERAAVLAGLVMDRDRREALLASMH